MTAPSPPERVGAHRTQRDGGEWLVVDVFSPEHRTFFYEFFVRADGAWARVGAAAIADDGDTRGRELCAPPAIVCAIPELPAPIAPANLAEFRSTPSGGAFAASPAHGLDRLLPTWLYLRLVARRHRRANAERRRTAPKTNG